MQPRIRRVCVVGAGPSGLVACKELREVGLEVRCFERSAHIGGVFSKGGHKSFYTLLNVSKWFIAYGDHPPEDPSVSRWTWREYADYLEGYAAHHGLEISREHEVRAISRQDGRYTLTVQAGDGSFAEDFDAVVICAGLHHTPRALPFDPQGLPTANAPELSQELLDSLAGRTVLLQGLGESTGDIIKQLRGRARLVVVTRRKRCFGPNIIRDHPPDLSVSRVWQSLPAWTYRAVDAAIARFARDPVSRRIARLSRASGLTCTSDFLVKNSGFAEALVEGQVEVKQGVATAGPDGVVFTDGSSLAVDHIINCTGFERRLPQLRIDGEELGPIELRKLYKHLFLPELGPSLSFVGFAKPTLGNIPALSELQSRCLAGWLSGRVPLPRHAAREIGADQRYYARNLDVDNEQLVHFMHYMDGLAAHLGCRPTAARLLARGDLRLLWHCFMGTNNPNQYRLFGPGSDYPANRALILALPVLTNPVHLPLYFAHQAWRGLAGLPGRLQGWAGSPRAV